LTGGKKYRKKQQKSNFINRRSKKERKILMKNEKERNRGMVKSSIE